MRQSSLTFFDPSKQLVIAQNNKLPSLDGSSLTSIKPANMRIWFTTENSDSVIWDEDHIEATFTHGMGCFPIVTIYDSDNEQVYPNIILIDGLSFKLNFGQEVYIPSEEPYCCVIGYGSAFGDSTGIHDEIATAAEQAQANALASQEARDDAIAAKNQAKTYMDTAQSYYEQANSIMIANSFPYMDPVMQYATLISAAIDTSNRGHLLITWSDPSSYATSFGTVTTWKSSTVVINYDHFPAFISDGTTVVVNTAHNAYATVPLDIEMENDTVFFKIFTTMYNGDVSQASSSPGQQIVDIQIDDIDDFMSYLRRGEINGLKSIYPVGSTLPFVTHSVSTQMSYLIGHYDYTGNYGTVSEYLDDSTRTHNVILIPDTGFSNASGKRIVVPYDLYEKTSALSHDTSFVSGKTYYTTNQCTTQYNVNNAQPGDTPVSLGLYEKGRITTASTGYGVYGESFIRQFLTKDATAGQWYVPNNIFEPASHTFSNNNATFLYGLSNNVKPYMHPARNMYLTYQNIQSIVYDACFLPNNFMLMRSNENGFNQQLDYYKNMTTNAQRIIRDPNGNALYVWSGTQANQPTKPENLVNLSIEGAWGAAGKLEGGQKQLDGTYPIICLA